MLARLAKARNHVELAKSFWLKPEKATDHVELAESFWLKPEKATNPVELAVSFWLKPENAIDPVELVKHFWLKPEELGDYVSKWVEAVASPKADGKMMIKFLKKNIFTHFGTPRVLISDGGSHFCNSKLAKAFEHYGVKQKVASPYHPQTNGQAEVSNREVNKILEKIVSTLRKDWSLKLDEALWVYQIAFKSLIGLTPFQMVYGKSCHLPVELEHKAYWALKFLNFDPSIAGEKRKMQMQELEGMRFHAYESSKLYKEKSQELS
ncbi:unnamed protein product [Trifolium pratense]|uniref:Uncharacterized protein n=1 Tax=Trifolium pratense TaxID=57577 RepID=A0ACB0LE07_TRIPR|nr:unnamed protein product [Trifolium pratense]